MRTLVSLLARRLPKLPPRIILGIGLVYVLTLGVVDFNTPIGLSFTPFYLFGIVFVAWGAGVWQAIVVSVVSTAVIVIAEPAAVQAAHTRWILLWNELIRFLLFIATAWMAAKASHLTRHLGSLVEDGVVRAKAQAEQHEETAARLAQKELLYRTLFELCPEGIVLEDDQGNILDANRAICAISGSSLEELLRQNVRRFVPPEEHAAVDGHLTALRAGKTLEHEVWNVRRDGQRCLLDLHEKPIALPDGKLGILIVARDITERRKAEEALRVSQRQLADAMDLAQLANWEYDVATGFYTFDDRFFGLYGTTTGRENGQQMPPETYAREFLYPEDAHLVFKGIERALATTDPNYAIQIEHRIRRRDGQTRHLQVRVAIVKDAAGRTVKIRGVNQDITERKRLEREILEISDREQGRIGQDLHDGLCQQLVSIAFDANSLESQLSSKCQPEAANAQRIADVLDQAITEARRLSRGLFPIRLEEKGLASALQELANTTRERFHIDCGYNSNEEVVLQGKAIAIHLYRIAQEAVNNAIKHARPQTISIQLLAHSDALELIVEDDGMGIPSVTPGKPSGMGLHIMDYRARSIGGALRVESNPHSGTTVTCRLPLQRPF